MPENAASITDDDLTLWTLGAPLDVGGRTYYEILQNGSLVQGAYGAEIWFVHHQIYVRGDDDAWWQWNGQFYEFYGVDRP